MIIPPAHRTETVREYYFSVKNREIAALNAERTSRGEKPVINLGIGSPDGTPPREALETLAKSFDGVSQAYAMQSGREIRVMVVPEKVSDAQAVLMSQTLRDRIQSELTYPGQIKISIIREYRAVETAK